MTSLIIKKINIKNIFSVEEILKRRQIPEVIIKKMIEKTIFSTFSKRYLFSKNRRMKNKIIPKKV